VDIVIPAPGQSAKQQVIWFIITVTTSVSGVVEVAYDNQSALKRYCFRQLVGSTQGLIESVPGGATVLEKLQTVPGAVWTFAIRTL
jgi:hypothetical protein